MYRESCSRCAAERARLEAEVAIEKERAAMVTAVWRLKVQQLESDLAIAALKSEPSGRPFGYIAARSLVVLGTTLGTIVVAICSHC